MNKLHEVYKKAVLNKPLLDALLLKVSRESNAKQITNLKNPQTAVDKVETKKEENPNRKYSLETVNDLSRGRLVYGSLDGMRNGVKIIKQAIKSSKLKIAKIDDYFTKPEGGYKGYHIDIKFPDGQHGEIQLHTVQTYAASLATHKTHEEYGDNPPPDAEERSEKDMDKINAMPKDKAEKLAGKIEDENEPKQTAAQIAALKMAMGLEKIRKNSFKK